MITRVYLMILILGNSWIYEGCMLWAAGQQEEQNLEVLQDSISQLIEEKNPDARDLLDQYTTLAQSTGHVDHLGRSLYFRAMHLDNIRAEGRVDTALIARSYIINNLNELKGVEWAEYVIKLDLVQTKHLIILNDKDEAIERQYELTTLIDSIRTLYPNEGLERYHILNYFNMANTFLFDNDDISTRYADSALFWSQKYGDPKYLYSAYNMKYYTRYFSDDGPELNSIADSCLRYASMTDDIRNRGESHMHKCNALVVLGKNAEGMQYCNIAVEAYAKLNDSLYLANTLHNIGNVFKKVGDQDRALTYYKKALTYTSKENESEYYNSIEAIATELHELGSYEEASNYYYDFTKGFYNFYTEQLESKFAEAEAKYQSEKKEAEIARQDLLITRQKNTRNILITGSIGIVAILTSVFFALYQRGKRRRKETELALQLEHERADGLEELSALKTDFFNNVSHELRTPLTLVIAPLEDALDKVRHVTLKKDLVLALNNSKRLLNLTNEILDLSKIDGSKLEMEYSAVELMSFLNRVYHSFDSLAKTRGIALFDNLSAEPPKTVKTDINKLEKIITNLVSNALKYSDDGKEVFLELIERELDKGRLVLRIKDKGRGIPMEEQDSVFDRFYQSGGMQHSAGTGIGLALVKELTELMSGRIDVESEVGMGSTFSIDIPVDILEDHQMDNEVEQVSIIDTQQLPPVLIGDARPSILIVEDDLEMSRYLVGLLEKNYVCDTAYNGVQALEQLKRKKYDLISSDIMMPEMDGFEFRSKLNEDEALRTTPFIMLSARVLEEDKLRGFQLGIDDYITKPFSSSEFQARVYNLLHNKARRLEAGDAGDDGVSLEEDFISKAKSIVIQYIDDPEFKVNQLAEELNYSRRQLGRILQEMTGLTPVSFILELKLQKAYRLIKERKYSTINEVRYEVGIESASYFSKAFKERFGVTPNKLN